MAITSVLNSHTLCVTLVFCYSEQDCHFKFKTQMLLKVFYLQWVQSLQLG